MVVVVVVKVRTSILAAVAVEVALLAWAVVVRNVFNILPISSGYWFITACPASFIWTSEAPGIFPAMIKELLVRGRNLIIGSGYD